MDAPLVSSGTVHSFSSRSCPYPCCSMSTDPDSRTGFGPYLKGVGPTYTRGNEQRIIRYNHVEDLEEALELHGKYVAAFLIEPIQGEAGYVMSHVLLSRLHLFVTGSSYLTMVTCHGFTHCVRGTMYSSYATRSRLDCVVRAGCSVATTMASNLTWFS